MEKNWGDTPSATLSCVKRELPRGRIRSAVYRESYLATEQTKSSTLSEVWELVYVLNFPYVVFVRSSITLPIILVRFGDL